MLDKGRAGKWREWFRWVRAKIILCVMRCSRPSLTQTMPGKTRAAQGIRTDELLQRKARLSCLHDQEQWSKNMSQDTHIAAAADMKASGACSGLEPSSRLAVATPIELRNAQGR